VHIRWLLAVILKLYIDHRSCSSDCRCNEFIQVADDEQHQAWGLVWPSSVCQNLHRTHLYGFDDSM
jgi:hypothetical protein